MTYYVIFNSEDGEVFVSKFPSKEKLIDALEGEDFGTNETFSKMPNDMVANEWEPKLLIIKGEIVVPKPKEVVKSFDIE